MLKWAEGSHDVRCGSCISFRV
ncbi:MAG TPA: hypothetical protein DCE41_28090 [Cytophagales bacterium]|nr:hypothetical protein [Cytophagales bacterium]HAA22217.1 hypothetical protein [Cytophagales bacterium]HAP62353.1 hypothetical protein [Cytophagales bacterium]